MRYCLAISILACLAPSLSQAEGSAADTQCKAEQDGISAIKDKYQPIFDKLQSEGEGLKNSDDAKKFAVDLSWTDTSIVFSTPSVTIKDQKITFGVPQVTMRTSDVIFGTPSVRMEQIKTGQYPEFTCHDTWIGLPFGGKTKGPPACTTTWHDTFASVPHTFMQQQHIKVDIPEFKFADTSIVVGVPEFFMQQQKIVMGVPQIKVSSVILNAKPLKDKSDHLSDEVASTKTAETKEMASSIHALFACYRTNLSQQRASAEGQFAVGLAQLDAIIQSLKSQGADPTNVTGPDGAVNLVQQRESVAKARDDALAKFDDALAKLDSSEKDAIAKLQS
ncbi:hypothetical protein UP10_01250 [Bradyrhizobium sp. LTSPM299]|nr:hypothetical protein UP10_01250 [Bradyrhizobium sp. LTSPM299]